MAQQTYTIVGATGRIGSIIAEHLIKKGHQVRALGRDQKKLEQLKKIGAETFCVDSFEIKKQFITTLLME